MIYKNRKIMDKYDNQKIFFYNKIELIDYILQNLINF